MADVLIKGGDLNKIGEKMPDIDVREIDSVATVALSKPDKDGLCKVLAAARGAAITQLAPSGKYKSTAILVSTADGKAGVPVANDSKHKRFVTAKGHLTIRETPNVVMSSGKGLRDLASIIGDGE